MQIRYVAFVLVTHVTTLIRHNPKLHLHHHHYCYQSLYHHFSLTIDGYHFQNCDRTSYFRSPSPATMIVTIVIHHRSILRQSDLVMDNNHPLLRHDDVDDDDPLSFSSSLCYWSTSAVMLHHLLSILRVLSYQVMIHVT